jgi:hypothetical protein
MTQQQDDLIERLRGATLGLCSEDAKGYIPRGVSAADCAEAADRLEAYKAEIEGAHHDIDRQMEIANIECNRAEDYRAMIERLLDCRPSELPEVEDEARTLIKQDANAQFERECFEEAAKRIRESRNRSQEGQVK